MIKFSNLKQGYLQQAPSTFLAFMHPKFKHPRRFSAACKDRAKNFHNTKSELISF